MAGRTSLKDIATAIGMSVSTVSLALSGDRRVSAPTRQRISEAAKRLGYVRDPILASIAAGRFRHPGKPVSIACNAGNGEWLARLKKQAEEMGMSVRPISGPIDTIVQRAAEFGVAALVLHDRGIDLATLAASAVPIILWEDEGPANPPVDLVETCEWWTAASGAIERVRAAGYQKPVMVLMPARPRHWHDDIRLASARIHGLPVMECTPDMDPGMVAAFLHENHADAVIAGLPNLMEMVQRLGIQLPYVSLIVHEGPWHTHVTGWLPDQNHRGQVTLELIEQRLRYGPRPPRRIVVPPRWQVGQTLPEAPRA